jgi:hypothetical protein
MRLDTLGKPPLVQNTSFEQIKVDKIKIEGIKEISPADTEEESSGGQARPRLGKVLHLLKKAEDDHKKKKKTLKESTSRSAIQIYQRMGSLETSAEQSGQTINVKV